MLISDGSSDVCSSDRGRGGSLGEKRDPHPNPSPALRERGYRAVVAVGRVKGSRRGSSPGVRGWLVPLVMGRRHGGPCRLGGSIRRGISTRSEEHTSELQSLMRTSDADFCLPNKQAQYSLTKQQKPQ